ncbi:MAG: histone-lysine N-methyltransferase [Spirochaetaceae bacterium]|nr:histone-lysine N-methyltransferase [Spirochaetaceae bacterium]MBQ3024530.1 histone-lysine N-methyltransferase [Spirochaetaceae bacterium]
MKEVLLNHNTNLLEEDIYSYKLQDVEKPELFRSIFPYSEVPKTVFNHRHVPMDMPENIYITDTSFRDGQQSRSPYTKEQIVQLYKFLHQLGGKKGIIRQCEFFVYSQKDKDALQECLSLGYVFPEITTWIRASKKDFEIAKNLGIKETGILMSCSDYHIFNKMGLSRKQAMEKYLSIIRECLDFGIKPRCHLEDITRADFYGFVLPFVSEIKKISEDHKIPIKLRVCDTLGLGVSYPGASLPRSIPGIIYGLRHYAGFSSETIEWHGHNDFYKSVSNASTAWLYGAGSVNCSLLGIGERTGNVPLEAMVFEYASLKGTLNGMNPKIITDIAEYIAKETHYPIPPMTPFVGENFNVTKAGIHADGLLKDEEIYNIFDTEKFLGKPPLVTVSNTSGLAGIAYWINNYFKLKGKNKISKNDEIVKKIKLTIDKEYSDGRVTFISTDEMKQLITNFGGQFE